MRLLLKFLKSILLLCVAFVGIVYIVNYAQGAKGTEAFVKTVKSVIEWEYGFTKYGTKIADEAEEHFIRSLKIIIPAFFISMILGIAKGIFMFYVKEYKIRMLWLFDRLIFGSLPDFFVFITVQLFLWSIMGSLVSMGIPRLDLMGHENWYNAIFPTIILCIYPIVFISHLTYKALSEDEQKDYIRTAYSKGTTKYFIVTRHLSSNQWGTILSYTQTIMLYIVTSLPVIEFVAFYEGAGYYMFKAIKENDIRIIMPIAVYFLGIMLLSILISDLIKYILVPASVEEEEDPLDKTVRKKQRFVFLKKSFVFIKNYPLLSLGSAMLSVLVFLSIFGSYLPFVNTELNKFTFKFVDNGSKIVVPPVPPGEDFWLGTDREGRDMLSMLIIGTKTTLIQVLMIATLRYVIAIPLGYFASISKSIRKLSSGLNGLFSFFPSIILVGVIARSPDMSMNEHRLYWLVFFIALIEVGRVSEVFRQEFVRIRRNDYVTAAIVAGATRIQLFRKHYLPNMYQKLIYNFVTDLSRVMFVLGLLGFITVYLKQVWVSGPSGGYYMNNSLTWPFFLSKYLEDIRTALWIPFYPIVCMTFAIFTFNILGEGLQQYFERRHRKTENHKKEKLPKKSITSNIVNFLNKKETVKKNAV